MSKNPGLAALTALVEAGDLHLVIAVTYPLDEIRNTHEHAERPGALGKIVIEV